MELSFSFSAKERARGRVKRSTIAEAREQFDEHGLIIFEDVLSPDLVADLRQAYFQNYAGLSGTELEDLGSRVGDERWMLSLPFEDPFDRADLYAPPLLYPFLKDVLGDALVLSSYCAVTSFPGADHQHVHRDHSFLFPEDPETSFALPAYAATVVIPLIDLDPFTGGTRVWPGSHRETPSLVARMAKGMAIRVPAGSAFVMDYRLLHGGEPNGAQVARPVLYLAYARPWFRDACNFKNHPPVRIGQDALSRLPEEHRVLFTPVSAG